MKRQNPSNVKSVVLKNEGKRKVERKTEYNAGQYFLVNIGHQMVRLDKGMSEEEVSALLGIGFKIEKTSIQSDQKRVYQFKSTGRTHIYKLLLRGGLLEWVMKSSQ